MGSPKREVGNYRAEISRLLQISPLRNQNLTKLLGIINKERGKYLQPWQPCCCLWALEHPAPVQPTFAPHLLISATTYLEIVLEREFQGVLDLFITNKAPLDDLEMRFHFQDLSHFKSLIKCCTVSLRLDRLWSNVCIWKYLMQSVINFLSFEKSFSNSPSGKLNFRMAHWEIHAPPHNTIFNMYWQTHTHTQ